MAKNEERHYLQATLVVVISANFIAALNEFGAGFTVLPSRVNCPIFVNPRSVAPRHRFKSICQYKLKNKE